MTQEHLILAGNEWLPAGEMHERTTVIALKLGRSLATSLWSNPNLSWEKQNSRTRSFGISFYRNGVVTTPLSTTLPKGEASNGLWTSMTTPESVYDLINVGQRHQFMVLTDRGPVVVHNCCQALARDILAYNLPAIEAAGYEVGMLVHDEVITEVPDAPEFNAENLSRLLATNPPWASGLPLAAAGFSCSRYRKG